MKMFYKAMFYFSFMVFFGAAMVAEGFGQTKFYTADDPIANQYIVVMNPATYNSESKEDMATVAADLASTYNGEEVTFLYTGIYKGFSIQMDETDAIDLSNDSEVEYVAQDSYVYMSDTQTSAPWNLDRIDQRSLPLSTTYTYSSNGAGVFVYIIDSGINPTHGEFGGIGGRAAAAADFVGGNGIDCNGHGTHVAGIVGASTYGVAKGANLLGVRVFGCSNSGSTSAVIAGVDWVRNNHGTKSVVNMSLGGLPSPALDDAVRKLINSGVPVVIAAGNTRSGQSGPDDANNISPARVREAITVGATDIYDVKASFSNFGTAVDVFAPGENITSTWYSGPAQALSGTSMAAPHVAGVIAQILQGSSPVPNPAKIQELVVANASIDKVSSRGTGSPNMLLYNGSFPYGGTTVPLYRYWNAPGSSGDHFYTTLWSEVGAGNWGEVLENVAGYGFSSQISGTVPLYRYNKTSATDHLYTTNFSELGTGSNGYVLERVECYIYSSSGSGRLPLYRYYSTSWSDHFYTTNYSEIGGGNSNYTYEGIEGYLQAP
jgi:subtilisin family serine protease